MNNRNKKEKTVEQLRGVASDASIIVIAKNSGVTVKQANQLRRAMKQANSSYLVAKNTLVKIAFQDSKFAPLADLLSGPVSLSYSDDPVATAKVLHSFCKENDKLQICGAMMGEKVLSLNEVEMLASLPSLDELRAKIIGLISAPATKVVRTIKEPSTKLARVLQAYSAK